MCREQANGQRGVISTRLMVCILMVGEKIFRNLLEIRFRLCHHHNLVEPDKLNYSLIESAMSFAVDRSFARTAIAARE